MITAFFFFLVDIGGFVRNSRHQPDVLALSNSPVICVQKMETTLRDFHPRKSMKKQGKYHPEVTCLGL